MSKRKKAPRGTSRAAPSTRQLLERIARRLTVMEHERNQQLIFMRLSTERLETRLTALAPLVAHCERLMREKESLMAHRAPHA